MGKKPKIPIRRVASDGCAVYIGREVDLETRKITNEGEPHLVHKEEWVEVIPVLSVRQVVTFSRLRNFTLENSADGLEELCSQLSRSVIDWNWTDLTGELLPKPHNNPDALLALSIDELMWLIEALQAETPAERKNA